MSTEPPESIDDEPQGSPGAERSRSESEPEVGVAPEPESEPRANRDPGAAAGVAASGDSPPEPAAEPSRRGCFARAVRAAGLAVLLLAAFALFELATWPDVAALRDENPESTAFIDHYEKRRGEPARWRPVSYGAISPHLKRAVLASEDIGFFDHNGFETAEMEIAVRETLKEGKPLRGASTLTQQLAKNLWLSPSRNPWRKVKEALLTVQLERELDKRRIFELYLNVAEFGPGIYGAEAAARHYFGVSAAGLSPRQAAALAAGLPKPSQWHPGSGSTTYQRRVERVLGRMDKAGWLWKVI